MEKKNSELVLEDNSNKVIEAFFEILSLKNLFRQGWLKNGVERKFCESVADHSFSTAMLAWLLAEEYFPNLDTSKIIKYSLIHEIGEIYAGDITPDDNTTDIEKFKLEFVSVKRVFDKLTNGEKYIKLWEEFEHSKNKEAKFVKQIDRLEMAFQAHFYENTLDMNLQDFKDSAKKVLTEEILKELSESIK